MSWRYVPNQWAQVDPQAIALLNELIARTDAYLVLSSTWRLGETGLEDTIAAMEVQGFKYGDRFLGSTCRMFRTPEGEPRYRGHEIQAWLDEVKDVESFVILDDDADMVHLLPRLVQTSNLYGLTSWDCDRAEQVLNDPIKKA